MVYRNRFMNIPVVFILCITVFFKSCTVKEKMNEKNTYFVEIVNCKDTLEKFITAGIIGKTSYFKNKELQVISLNYVTEDHPDMHYFKGIKELVNPVKPGTRKIRIELAGNYTIDSTFYSLQKFIYNKNAWEKYSDMGFIKAWTSDGTSAKDQPIINSVVTRQIVNNAVISTYDEYAASEKRR